MRTTILGAETPRASWALRDPVRGQPLCGRRLQSCYPASEILVRQPQELLVDAELQEQQDMFHGLCISISKKVKRNLC